MIGDRLPPEWRVHRDPVTGRTLRQYTSAHAHSYPLYYFIPSITKEGDRIVFHSERGGSVQLYSLDLASGAIRCLTDGKTPDSNWKIWCPRPTSGIYDHLSVLNGPRREVFYFQDDEIRATHLDTLNNRRVHALGDRLCISQNATSPNGRLLAFVHTARNGFNEALRRRDQDWTHHDPWRNTVPTTIGVVDCESGACRDVLEIDFHVHHVIFVDDETLLINHIRDSTGMWVVRLDGTRRRTLRPADANGRVVHQVVTARGIFYEAVSISGRVHRSVFGRYDIPTDTFAETELPFSGYVHVGFDPLGEVAFFEHHGDAHQLVRVHHFGDPVRQSLEVLRTMPAYPKDQPGQYCHAHPFMSTERDRIYFTELIDGISQICSISLDPDT
ncbi:MAG: hypothetical protein R3F07_09725 [Opitutaceae bacterium]